MMTMMALMVFAVSGFAVKYNAKDVPTDPQKKYEYLKSIDVTNDNLACKKIINILQHDFKNLKTELEIKNKINEIITKNQILVQDKDAIIITISASYLYYSNIENKYSKIINLYKDTTDKPTSVALSHYFLKEYNIALPIFIKNKQSYAFALKCIKKSNSISLNQIEAIKAGLNKPNLVLELIDIIKNQKASTLEESINKLNLILSLSNTYPPSIMKVGSELAWAKVELSINKNIENLQKIIKIKLDIEKALNE